MAATPTDKLVWDDRLLADPHRQTDKARRVQAMFDEIAPTYERVNRVLSAGRDASWRRRAVELTAITPTDRVLDLACGTGDFSRAFAAANPVVSSRVGSISEMMEDGISGFLVESEDEQEFANRIVMLLNNPQLRMNMGLHARDVAMKKWNAQHVAEKTIGAYRLVLSTKHAVVEPVAEPSSSPG